MTKRLANILGINGLKRVYKTEPLLLVMPVGFFLLLLIHPSLIAVPLILYYAIGLLWKD